MLAARSMPEWPQKSAQPAIVSPSRSSNTHRYSCFDGPLKVQPEPVMNLIVSTTKWTCKFPANEVLGWNTKYRAVLTDRQKQTQQFFKLTQ